MKQSISFEGLGKLTIKNMNKDFPCFFNNFRDIFITITNYEDCGEEYMEIVLDLKGDDK